MYNELFSIGPITVYGYGLMIGLGVVAAYFLAHFRAPGQGLEPNLLPDLAIAVLICGFAGAKLMYIVVEFPTFVSDPWRVLSSTGFVVYGGIIGGAIGTLAFLRRKNRAPLRYVDLLMPSVALAQGFGRIGCFLAGCCYGAHTDSPLGVVFHNSQVAPNGVPLLPTQLFMAGGDLLLAAILVLYARKKPRGGRVCALYLVLYSVGRFAVEFLRADSRGTIGMLSTSQFISIFTLAAGVLLFVLLKKQTLTLRKISASDGRDVFDMLQRLPPTPAYENEVHGMVYADFPAWLVKNVGFAEGVDLPEGWVPQTTFWLCLDGKPIGMVRIRHRLNENLRNNGGHIGYGIAQHHRGNGFADKMLALALDECKKLDISEVQIGALIDNLPSIKTIERNGGVLLRTTEQGKNIYKITLADGGESHAING